MSVLCSMVGASFTVAAAAEVLRSKKGISAVGNAQIDTAQSKFGGASALFDGTGDALATAGIAFGTGDFTVEYWIRSTSLSGYDIHWDLRGTPTSNLSPIVYTNNGVLYMDVGATTVITGSTLSTNTWYHIALSRSGSSTKLFVNGTQSGSTYTDTNNYVSAATLYIGELYSLGGNGVVGHMDEFRISNSARYTANFTPSTTAFVNDANTLLLIHANGTDATTFFEDDNGVRAPNGIIAGGNAQISTAQSKFGGASALFDGTGDYLQMPYNASISRFHDNTNFTLEYWVRVGNFSNVASGNGINASIVFGNQSVDNFAQYWSFGPIANGNVQFFYYSGSANQYTTSGVTLVTNTWYHLAFVKQSNSLKIYVDGVERGSGTITNTPSNGTTSEPITIGAFNNVSFNGYLDEIRVSNTARYTANFTAPTSPFVNDTNTLLLIHGDGTNAATVFRDDNGARTQKSIQAVGNAQIDTAQSKFGGASALFDGNGDYLIVGNTVDNDMALTGTTWTVEYWARINSHAGAYQGTIGIWDPSGSTGSVWYVSTNAYNGTNKMGIAYTYGTNTTSGDIAFGSVLSTGVWQHHAFVRNGNTLTAYLDGVSQGTHDMTGRTIDITGYNSSTNTTLKMTVGALTGGAGAFNGHLDEIRISNIARYTTGFTAPTAPFQNDANTVLLLHMDGTDASTVFFDDNGIAPYTP